MPGTIILLDPQGNAREVPTEAAGGALEQGWRVQTEDDRLGRLSAQAKEVDYGGVGGGVKAGLAAGLRGVTLGGSDVAARALGGEDTRFDLEALRETNPGISTGAEIVGAALPAFLSGGAATPAGAAARLGRGVTALGEGAGTLGRIGAATAGGAAEGALYGLGSGVSELALSDEPLTLEHAVSTLSSHALFGAATGGLAGGALKAGEIGLARAKGAIDGALERRAAAKARTPEEAVDAGDLGLLDKSSLDVLEDAELARIAKEQAPQREAAVDELDKWRRGNRDAHDLRELAKSSSEADMREASGAFDRANFRLRSMLDDRVGLAKDPGSALPFLRKQTQALEELKMGALSEQARWRVDVDTAPQRIREEIQAGTVAGEKGPFTPNGLDLAVERVTKEMQSLEWGGAFRLGLKEPPLARRIPVIDDMIARNRGFQERLEEMAKAPVSDRLSKIAEARDALGGAKAPSLTEAVINSIPFAGPLATAVTFSKKAIGGLRAGAGKAAARMAAGVSSFLDVTSKGAARISPLAPVIATKVLAATSYAPPERKQRAGAEPPALKNEATLPKLYRARTDEIKSQVHIAPDGSFQMRPEARARMADRISAVGHADPRAADQMETAAARRLEWLASQIPRRPDLAGVRSGPDTWQPSDMEMRSWARKVAAAEDPQGVIERLAHGAISPEDGDAMRALYPEMMSDVSQQLLAALPTLQKSLPYGRRVALSIFSGVPVDPAMDPQIIAAFQAQFAYEPEQPRAQPQFGSVKAADQDISTPAQRREQGAA